MAKKIVNVTHRVRHEALIEQQYWRHKSKAYDGTDTDIGYVKEIDEIEFVDDYFRNLVHFANIGCKYSIKTRLDKLRDS